MWDFRDKKTGRFRSCRVRDFLSTDDPITEMSGCSGEISNDLRKRDLRDGCPICTEDVIENGSEPDVMARWGFR